MVGPEHHTRECGIMSAETEKACAGETERFPESLHEMLCDISNEADTKSSLFEREVC